MTIFFFVHGWSVLTGRNVAKNRRNHSECPPTMITDSYEPAHPQRVAHSLPVLPPNVCMSCTQARGAQALSCESVWLSVCARTQW